MEGLASCGTVGGRFLPRLPFPSRSGRFLSSRRARSLRVFASRDGPPELDKWDQMELKFGRLLGEDPKLTLAKIMARKSNPDVSYLDVEKSFRKKKGKLDDYMINIPADIDVEGQSSVLPNRTYLSNQKTQKMLSEGKLNLSRPAMKKETKTTRPDGKPALIEGQPNILPGNIDKGIDSNITLRKPSSIQVDDIELENNSRLKIKPNLFLQMRKGSTEDFSDVTLLKKPEMTKLSLNPDLDNMSSDGSDQSCSSERKTPDDDVRVLNSSEILCDKLEMTDEIETLDENQKNSLHRSPNNGMTNVVNPFIEEASDDNSELIPKSTVQHDDLGIGLQPPRQSGVEPQVVGASATHMDQNSMNSLLGKPMRFDSSVKDVPQPRGTETLNLNDEGHNYAAEVDNFIPAEQEEREDNDWKRAEHLLHTGGRDEVELISCSGRGFVVSFGSLIGFLPYRNLGAKWKFIAFESWLRKNGLDPSMYRQNMSIVGSYVVQDKNLALDSNKIQETDQKDEETLPKNMKFEDLLKAYDQEKTKFLSSFVGQRIRVSVLLANRNSRRLLFSARPKEKEEFVEKKRSLMVSLRVVERVIKKAFQPVQVLLKIELKDEE